MFKDDIYAPFNDFFNCNYSPSSYDTPGVKRFKKNTKIIFGSEEFHQHYPHPRTHIKVLN